MVFLNNGVKICIAWPCRSVTVFLVSLYGVPLAQSVYYFALHSLCLMAQLNTIILSLTALNFVNWLEVYSQWRTH